MPALASRFHVLAPDYPGFGNSDTPDPGVFPYAFDTLGEVTEAFLEAKGFDATAFTSKTTAVLSSSGS